MRATTLLGVLVPFMMGCSLMLPPKPHGSDTGTDSDTDVQDDTEIDTTDDPVEDTIDDVEGYACSPGSTFCDGDDYMQCEEDGTSASVVATCTEACIAGTGCVGWESCEMAALLEEFSGCSFVAVPLPVDTDIDGTDLEFGLVIANTNSGATAHVTVNSSAGAITSLDIPPGSVEMVTLPLTTEWHSLANDDWSSFSSADAAYTVDSTAPIRVTQYNPYDPSPIAGPVSTSSAGGSMLLPIHALTGNYVVATVPPLSLDRVGAGTKLKRASYIAIVGIEEGDTNVSVTLGGDMQGGGGLAPGSAGTTFSVTVGHNSTIFLASAVPPDCAAGNPTRVLLPNTGSEDYSCHEADHDLSGTRIQAESPVAVFTGSTAALVPYDVWDMDHLEEQIPPAETLSGSYVIGPIGTPGDLSLNTVKIVGAHDGTHIVTSPPVAGLDGATIHLGDVLTVNAENGFELEADHPVLVMQFDHGRYFAGGTPRTRGDPSMTIVPNVSQWTSRYVVTAPTPWAGTGFALTYVHVIREAGSGVLLDGSTFTPADGWHTISSYEAGIVQLSAGMHIIEGDTAMGLITFGQGEAMGLAHPTGMYLDHLASVAW